ncbi:hypothetical protein F4860DRAFT_473280 [Xylaria cubensis]|nr:hypothetical protein F4860DRAFT_473280 [Xylaria cubensis]
MKGLAIQLVASRARYQPFPQAPLYQNPTRNITFKSILSNKMDHFTAPNHTGPSGNDIPTSSVVGEDESDTEDPVDDLFRQPALIIDGDRGEKEILCIIDTGSTKSLIPLGIAAQLSLTIEPALKREELEWINGDILVAPWFIRLRVYLPRLRTPRKTLKVLVVDIPETFLLLGTGAIRKLDILRRLVELGQSPGPATINSNMEDTSFNRNSVLVILDRRRTKEQKKHDEDVRQRSADVAARLAEIRMLHGSSSSLVAHCSGSSGLSTTERQSTSSRALSLPSSVFSRTSTRTSEVTTIYQPSASTKTKGQT